MSHQIDNLVPVAIMAALSSSGRRWMMMTCLAFLLVPFSSANVVAQSSSYIDGGAHRSIKWDQMVGTIVEVDGLAWGAQSKGGGAHLMLPQGKVYLRNIDLTETDLEGRLLRVSGVLRKARSKKVPQGVQGHSQSFDYFYVEVIEVVRIDKVVHPLLPSHDDWIVVGMLMAKATDLIRSRRLQEFGLQLAASPDGAKAHSYQLSENEVLLFYELEARVRSVAKVSVSRVSKGVDRWTTLVGCRLPGKPNHPSKN